MPHGFTFVKWQQTSHQKQCRVVGVANEKIYGFHSIENGDEKVGKMFGGAGGEMPTVYAQWTQRVSTHGTMEYGVTVVENTHRDAAPPA